MATILYRYGKRHGLNVANFEGHQSSIDLPEAVRQVRQARVYVARKKSQTSRVTSCKHAFAAKRRVLFFGDPGKPFNARL